MKRTIILLSLISILTLSCKNKNISKDHEKFVGSWSGTESDNQMVGVTKYWIQHRFADGTYVLMFTTIIDCEADLAVEKGKWYLKDSLFHETNNESGTTDIYTYEILDKDHIKFKAKKLGIQFANTNYEFIDTRMED